MARRKISIEDAFDVLHKAGIRVKVERVEEVIPPLETETLPPVIVGNNKAKGVVVTLRAQHQIANTIYGPGKSCVVPVELAATLLYQDQRAVKADEDFLCSENRFYLVTRRSKGSQSAHIGLNVPEKLFTGNLNANSRYVDVDTVLEI